ncbi:MAG TPA: APC family permease [Actinomycetota bacterium]|nr:APC family permease [Actinomycetota bacterium]
MKRFPIALKRIVVGRPRSSAEMEHTLLPKAIALPVFSSDALSSVAYATQEMLLVLATLGVGYLHLVTPVSIAVAVLLLTVVISYQQIVKAYPSGGGAYIVAKEALGVRWGLLVAAALLTDYTLTVAVSITAGVDAIVSALPALLPHKLGMVLFFIALVMVVNLRGVKESGTLFAFPVYGFVLVIWTMIATGVIRCFGGCPAAPSAHDHLPAMGAFTVFILLKTFSAGTTALTGIEAIAEGVPVFRYPQSRNAAFTLGILGGMAVSMLIGVSWLAQHTHVHFTEESTRTVVAQVAYAVFDGGFMFFAVQVFTAVVLVLAANTAFTGCVGVTFSRDVRNP